MEVAGEAESPSDVLGEPAAERAEAESLNDAILPDEAAPPLAPEHVAEAPALAVSEPTAPAVATAEPLAEDIETVAARRAQQQAAKRGRRQVSGWSTAILALIAINLALVGRRADVVRWLPHTASLYAAIGLPANLHGLVFTNVTTGTEIHEGVHCSWWRARS